jgi:hypothetical protein
LKAHQFIHLNHQSSRLWQLFLISSGFDCIPTEQNGDFELCPGE